VVPVGMSGQKSADIESPLLPALVIDLMIHDFEKLVAVAITPSQRETLKSLWLRYLLGLADNDTDLFDPYDEETLWELVSLGLTEVENNEWFLTGKGAQLAKILCRAYPRHLLRGEYLSTSEHRL
jgi:hypothetical protein